MHLRLVVGLGIALWLAGCSTWLFYPESEVPITPVQAGLEFTDLNLTAADGTGLNAWWLPAKSQVPVKGTLLYLHGNGGNLAWHLGAVAWLPAAGWQVLMLDYRGYGHSQGSPSLPAVYQDIDAAFAWLKRSPQVAGKPLAVLGQSLGGALAVRYLAEQPQRRGELSALVLDGAPASYRSVARHMLAQSALTWAFQWPLSWLMPEHQSALYAAPKLGGVPLLIFHSMDDSVVPLANGLSLYQAAPPPRMFQLTRGPHVQTFNEPLWRSLLLKFLEDPQKLSGLRRLAELPAEPAN